MIEKKMTESEFSKGIKILQDNGKMMFKAMDNGKKTDTFEAWYQSIAPHYGLDIWDEAVEECMKHQGIITLGNFHFYLVWANKGA